MKARNRHSGQDPEPRPFPLIFGVSGHRDLRSSDVALLREQFSQVLARFRAAYPHTPFCLLTPLAEGADRLAAHAALAAEVSLFVPLPMKQREYERDFATSESLAEFRKLLAMAESHWTIQSGRGPAKRSRTQQYAAVGDFIARHSHVLILFWDGQDNKKIGGTAWVKKRREDWVKAVGDPFRAMVSIAYGPTIQIVTPRASGTLPGRRPLTVGSLPPSAAEFAALLAKGPSYQRGAGSPDPQPLYQRLYWAINAFNADVASSAGVKNRKKHHSATRSRQ